MAWLLLGLLAYAVGDTAARFSRRRQRKGTAQINLIRAAYLTFALNLLLLGVTTVWIATAAAKAGGLINLASFMGEDTPERRAQFLSTIPIGRFSTPEDMGNAACYLCSDEASMITGVCMEVDGGRCI